MGNISGIFKLKQKIYGEKMNSIYEKLTTCLASVREKQILYPRQP